MSSESRPARFPTFKPGEQPRYSTKSKRFPGETRSQRKRRLREASVMGHKRQRLVREYKRVLKRQASMKHPEMADGYLKSLKQRIASLVHPAYPHKAI